MKKVVLFFAIAITSSLFAKDKAIDNPLQPQNFDIPATPAKGGTNKNVQDLKVNQFYLNMSSDDVKNVQEKHKKNKHVLDRFDEIRVNQNPVVKSIVSTDTISMHPYYITSILLPKGSVVSYASGKNFAQNGIKHSENMVTLEIGNDFDRGNVVIVYAEKEQNKLLNIMIKRFDVNEIKNEVLNTVYSYVDVPELNNAEVIQAFVQEYGRYPEKKHEYLYYGDVVYRIVNDDVYGNVFVKNKKYRITSTIIQK